MSRFLSGCAIGSLVTLIVITLFSGIIFSRAERQLISDWRKILPGMNRDAVIDLFGEPLYDLETGEPFPGWAQQAVPDNYHEKHGLLVFITPTLGPMLLFVFLDAEDSVSFVSSADT